MLLYDKHICIIDIANEIINVNVNQLPIPGNF